MKQSLPDKFRGSLSIEDFISRYELTDAQIATLQRLVKEGKLWSERDYVEHRY